MQTGWLQTNNSQIKFRRGQKVFNQTSQTTKKVKKIMKKRPADQITGGGGPLEILQVIGIEAMLTGFPYFSQ